MRDGAPLATPFLTACPIALTTPLLPMARVSPELKMMYQHYVSEAPKAGEHLEFLLDYLGHSVALDGSRESLVEVERIYWLTKPLEIPEGLSDLENFALLIGQYLGEMIIRRTGAKWVQCTDSNPMRGHPCLDGFGNKIWDRIYPLSLSNNLQMLKSEKPSFPGVRTQTVFACQFDRAVKVSEASGKQLE